MDSLILKALKSKQIEVARLDEWADRERSAIDQPLGSLDDDVRAKRTRLERQIEYLKRAASLEPDNSTASIPRRKVLNRHERDELFHYRANIVDQLFTEANGREIHVGVIADAMLRPITTIKDYLNDQQELRPGGCFWENGSSKSHFRPKAEFAHRYIPAERQQQVHVASNTH